MQNTDTSILLVIHATLDFPAYFVHPIQRLLQEKGLILSYADADSHSDEFYIDYILQTLEQKRNIFVYIHTEPDQKRIPKNCIKILSYLQKVRSKVNVLLSSPNVMIQAYTRNFSICPHFDLRSQVEYILSIYE